jgi:hypothetical protein
VEIDLDDLLRKTDEELAFAQTEYADMMSALANFGETVLDYLSTIDQRLDLSFKTLEDDQMKKKFFDTVTFRKEMMSNLSPITSNQF